MWLGSSLHPCSLVPEGVEPGAQRAGRACVSSQGGSFQGLGQQDYGVPHPKEGLGQETGSWE